MTPTQAGLQTSAEALQRGTTGAGEYLEMAGPGPSSGRRASGEHGGKGPAAELMEMLLVSTHILSPFHSEVTLYE